MPTTSVCQRHEQFHGTQHTRLSELKNHVDSPLLKMFVRDRLLSQTTQKDVDDAPANPFFSRRIIHGVKITIEVVSSPRENSLCTCVASWQHCASEKLWTVDSMARFQA